MAHGINTNPKCIVGYPQYPRWMPKYWSRPGRVSVRGLHAYIGYLIWTKSKISFRRKFCLTYLTKSSLKFSSSCQSLFLTLAVILSFPRNLLSVHCGISKVEMSDGLWPLWAYSPQLLPFCCSKDARLLVQSSNVCCLVEQCISDSIAISFCLKDWWTDFCFLRRLHQIQFRTLNIRYEHFHGYRHHLSVSSKLNIVM